MIVRCRFLKNKIYKNKVIFFEKNLCYLHPIPSMDNKIPLSSVLDYKFCYSANKPVPLRDFMAFSTLDCHFNHNFLVIKLRTWCDLLLHWHLSTKYADGFRFEPAWLTCIVAFKPFYVSSQIGWIYGSVTEDILSGFKMHCRGWRSIYCMPVRPAFKGSAPINLSDRLHQVLRWALGSVEIFFSRHCPLWYGYGGGRLKWLQRLAYINTIVYPFTSLPLIAYCTIPAVCLLTGKFIIPTVTSIIFLFTS